MKTDELAWVRRAGRSGAARALREANNLSLQEEAEEIGVHFTTIARWERGLRRPTGDAALRWARLLRRLANGEAS